MFKFNAPSEFYELCKTKKDGDYYLSLHKDHPKRSLKENRYYWGVVLSMIAEHTGMEIEEAHEFCKLTFN